MSSISLSMPRSSTWHFLSLFSGNVYSIRFFTPKEEIPLCGHATLASSKIIFDDTDIEQISFLNCENIELEIRKTDGNIVMQFPVYDTREIDVPQSCWMPLV
jgi:predicted PhzF superfamily epimerase YddE/YHI9